MPDLEALLIKLEQARAIEANKRQKREELEEQVAQAACPFRVNQRIEGEYGGYHESAIVHEIKYRTEWPHFWARAKFLTRSGEVFIHGGNVNDWKPAPIDPSPF